MQCMCSADLTKDGMKDIMVGRDDGTVEVWGFDGGGGRPKLIFERSLQESVTSIESGLVTNGNYKLTLTLTRTLTRTRTRTRTLILNLTLTRT